jgi:hypothetical protein
VEGMKDTAKEIITVLDILVEDDPILSKTKFFSTIFCTASDLLLKAISIEHGGGFPPKKNFNPPYHKVFYLFYRMYIASWYNIFV